MSGEECHDLTALSEEQKGQLVAALCARIAELKLAGKVAIGLLAETKVRFERLLKERDEARAALDEMKEYLWNVPGGLPEFEYIARIGAAGQVIKEYEARRALARSEGGGA